MSAAGSLMQRSGTFTVAEVAHEVGLSRSAVYEYYTSASDLVADVLVDELRTWSQALSEGTAAAATTQDRVHAWVGGILDYVVDGRHALLRAAGAIDIPAARRSEVQALHRDLVAPLVGAFGAVGRTDAERFAAYAWGATEAAIDRIEAGVTDPTAERQTLTAFLDGALSSVGER